MFHSQCEYSDKTFNFSDLHCECLFLILILVFNFYLWTIDSTSFFFNVENDKEALMLKALCIIKTFTLGYA